MRVLVFPMLSNRRSLGGDSCLMACLKMARGVPGWRFYLVLPDRWARENQGLRRAFALPNVTPVPLRFETANRTLNSLVLDASGLRRFRQGVGDLEVDAAWVMCSEIIPELKSILRAGYSEDVVGDVPVIAQDWSGLRDDGDQWLSRAWIAAAAVGYWTADAILWEAGHVMRTSLHHFGKLLNGMALAEIERKSEVVPAPILPEEYPALGSVPKAPVFTVAFPHKMTWQKRPGVAFEAVGRLWETGRPVQILVFDTSGNPVPGGERPWIRVERPASRSDYLRRLASCHVALSTTAYENIGLSNVDALAVGLPLLAERRLAFPEMVENPDAYPFWFHGLEDLVRRLGAAMERPEALREGAEGRRAFVLERFGIERVMARWAETTRRLRAEADRLFKVSDERRRRLVSLAEAIAVKKDGRFTKRDFERAYREKYGAARLPGYGIGLARRVLLDAGFEDDFTQEEPTYAASGRAGTDGHEEVAAAPAAGGKA